MMCTNQSSGNATVPTAADQQRGVRQVEQGDVADAANHRPLCHLGLPEYEIRP